MRSASPTSSFEKKIAIAFRCASMTFAQAIKSEIHNVDLKYRCGRFCHPRKRPIVVTDGSGAFLERENWATLVLQEVRGE
jgi:hypothetical protein